jgi:hypothetical protein
MQIDCTCHGELRTICNMEFANKDIQYSRIMSLSQELIQHATVIDSHVCLNLRAYHTTGKNNTDLMHTEFSDALMKLARKVYDLCYMHGTLNVEE